MVVWFYVGSHFINFHFCDFVGFDDEGVGVIDPNSIECVHVWRVIGWEGCGDILALRGNGLNVC